MRIHQRFPEYPGREFARSLGQNGRRETSGRFFSRCRPASREDLRCYRHTNQRKSAAAPVVIKVKGRPTLSQPGK
ncbi:MAG: hypothetical protein LBI86_12260, partial [Treponema sp.]|nr:hypothetical protein [Treponema sp.]